MLIILIHLVYTEVLGFFSPSSYVMTFPIKLWFLLMSQINRNKNIYFVTLTNVYSTTIIIILSWKYFSFTYLVDTYSMIINKKIINYLKIFSTPKSGLSNTEVYMSVYTRYSKIKNILFSSSVLLY